METRRVAGGGNSACVIAALALASPVLAQSATWLNLIDGRFGFDVSANWNPARATPDGVVQFSDDIYNRDGVS